MDLSKDVFNNTLMWSCILVQSFNGLYPATFHNEYYPFCLTLLLETCSIAFYSYQAEEAAKSNFKNLPCEILIHKQSTMTDLTARDIMFHSCILGYAEKNLNVFILKILTDLNN